MRRMIVPLLFLLSVSFVLGEDLYHNDYLEVELEVSGEITSQNARDVEARLQLVPQDSFRQRVQALDTSGTLGDQEIIYEWDRIRGPTSFSYSSQVTILNQRRAIRDPIAYPLRSEDLVDVSHFLEPTEHIDSQHALIAQQAAQLAAGQDDLFSVVFNVVTWVEQNVEYDLNTLTEKASQKASWVYENRVGVCDEMTSLAIAMLRSLGIPAKFVTGLTYTESELFNEPWQAHGWMEVYFPSVGWVSFDPTFGEYGYVDVTHIKLLESDDPASASVTYVWFGDALEGSELDFTPVILDIGERQSPTFSFELDVLEEEVGHASDNVVRARVKNLADYYSAIHLTLAAPSELEISDAQRTLLFAPGEEKELSWLVRANEVLDENFVYTFPLTLFSETNISTQSAFRSVNDGVTLEGEDLTVLTQVDDTLLAGVSIACDDAERLELGAEQTLGCVIESEETLRGAELCIANECELIDLVDTYPLEVELSGDQVGWHTILLSVEHSDAFAANVVSYQVGDEAALAVHFAQQEPVFLSTPFTIDFSLERESFTTPKNVEVVLRGTGFTQTWQLSELRSMQDLTLELSSYPLKKNNKFVLEISWDDASGSRLSERSEFFLEATPRGFGDQLRFVVNSVVQLVS